MVGLGLALLCLAWLAILLTVPSVRELRGVRTQVASDIYTVDSLLLGRYYNQYRTVVGYEEIPKHVFEALVATEDERFFEHHGVDYRSWARVLVRTILQGNESGGGGSTISQQLAKNLFPRRDYLVFPLVVNKVREIAIARRLERAYSKQELLGLYFDCDADTLLVKVNQIGGAACHEGYQSCFFRRVDPASGGVSVEGERVFDPAEVYKKK